MSEKLGMRSLELVRGVKAIAEAITVTKKEIA